MWTGCVDTGDNQTLGFHERYRSIYYKRPYTVLNIHFKILSKNWVKPSARFPGKALWFLPFSVSQSLFCSS